MTSPRRRRLATSLLAVSLIAASPIVAACGGSDDDATSASEGTDSSTGGGSAAGETGGSASGTATGAAGDAASATGDASSDAGSAEEIAASCGVGSTEREAQWPFVVPQDVAVTGYTVDGLRYVVTGVTVEPDVVLIAAMDNAFPGFDVGEPDGAADAVSVQFLGDTGDGVLSMTDDDADGCWDVEMQATYADTPDLFLDGSDLETAGRTDDPVDPLEDLAAAGRGELIGGRGTTQLIASQCRVEPLAIEAATPTADADDRAAGALSVRDLDGAVGVMWTYGDGTTFDAQRVDVLQRTSDSLSLIVDGETEAGPESLVIELVCISSE